MKTGNLIFNFTDRLSPGNPPHMLINSVVDPHWFQCGSGYCTDPDPTFSVNADLDREPDSDPNPEPDPEFS